MSMLEVMYHTIVRGARGGHRNAVVGMILNMLQGVTMMVAFLLFFQILGLRSSPIRGDMLLFIMSGIFVYLTHIKAVSAVMGASGPTSSMMLHRPMNTIIAIVSAAISSLYTQIITLLVILSFYHVAINPITIEDPIAAAGYFIMGWVLGCAVGGVFFLIDRESGVEGKGGDFGGGRII